MCVHLPDINVLSKMPWKHGKSLKSEVITMQKPELGKSVVYHDSKGRPHDALITCVHQGTTSQLVNLVYVSDDVDRKDSYGRQMERATSVAYVADWTVHGNYYRFPEDNPIPYREPAQV